MSTGNAFCDHDHAGDDCVHRRRRMRRSNMIRTRTRSGYESSPPKDPTSVVVAAVAN